MELTEKMLTRNYVYKGRIINVREDTVELPGGKSAYREVCEHMGGVGILPITDDGQIVLVRQYRYPYEEELLEIPAGKMDQKAENHLACGIRELKEETGYEADDMIYLGEVYPSPGFLTERLYLYLAKGLHSGACQPDEDEFVETVLMPADELEQKIAKGEIRDGKTIAAMYKARILGFLD